MDVIKRMQDNLLLIRRAVGWTATEFGDKIGVTRQTINNIEGGRNKLTKTQYIAMRSVLDAEIIKSPKETKILVNLLDALVDNPKNYTAEERKIIVSKANIISPAILTHTSSREEVSNEWESIFKGTSILKTTMMIAATIGAVSGWLTYLLDEKEE